MNRISSITFLAALAASGVAAGAPAYTTPVGYVTETIAGKASVGSPDSFSLISLTLQSASLRNGSVTSLTSTTLRDAGANFDTLLTAGKEYVLRVTSGTQKGAIIAISTWGTASGNNSTDVVTGQNLVGTGIAVGDTFEIRPAATLSSLFGATNTAALKSGTLSTADVIWIPTGGGNFEKYYYSPGSSFPVTVAAGWKNSSGGDASNAAIIYTDAIFIQRRDTTNLQLLVSGEVIKSSTQILIEGNSSRNLYNYVSSVFPIGTTLGNSGLQASLLAGSLSSADIVWVPAGPGTYNKFYYSPGSTFPVNVVAGWKDANGNDATNQALTSGLIIQRRGATNITVSLTPPAGYGDL